MENQLSLLEQVVQGRDAGAKFRTIQKGCVKCHEIRANQNKKGVNWDVLPPKIPARWLPHSRFRHNRHDMLECYECHLVRPPVDPQAADVRSDAGSIFQSSSAGDLLMPSIATCRKCHGSPVSTPIPGRVKARDDCIECHGYHHTRSTTPAIREEWDRLDGKNDVTERLWRKREVPLSREKLLQPLRPQ